MTVLKAAVSEGHRFMFVWKVTINLESSVPQSFLIGNDYFCILTQIEYISKIKIFNFIPFIIIGAVKEILMQHTSDKAEGITVICLNYVQDKT